MIPLLALLFLISGSRALFFNSLCNVNGTEFTDDVLNRTTEEIIRLHLDPLELPNLSFEGGNDSVKITNHIILGLSHVRRLGPVDAQKRFFTSKFRSAFQWYNFSQDVDVAIHIGNVSYPHGHIHQSCDNITSYQVFKLNHFTKSLYLEEYELSIGECEYKITGLGERAEDFREMMNEFFHKIFPGLSSSL